MKYLIFTIAIILFSNCKSQEMTFSNEEPNQYDLIIIANTIGNEKNLITFTEIFDNDNVSVLVDNQSIFSGPITTDRALGSARGVPFDRNSDLLNVMINDKELTVKNISEYRFIYVYRKENGFNILYRKKPILFY